MLYEAVVTSQPSHCSELHNLTQDTGVDGDAPFTQPALAGVYIKTRCRASLHFSGKGPSMPWRASTLFLTTLIRQLMQFWRAPPILETFPVVRPVFNFDTGNWRWYVPTAICIVKNPIIHLYIRFLEYVEEQNPIPCLCFVALRCSEQWKATDNIPWGLELWGIFGVDS